MAQNWQVPDSEGYYDIAQLVKRLEWLDSERRKDKDTISLLEERVAQVQNDNVVLKSTVKDFQNELLKYSSVFGRLDQIDVTVAQNRVGVMRTIEDNDKTHSDRENEIDRNRKDAQESISRAVLEIRKQLEPIAEIRKSMQARMEDTYKITHSIEELEHRVEKIALERDDFLRFQKANEEGRKLDTKRLVDMQNELNAYRKRNEEMRAKVDLSADVIKKVETRVTELANSEGERKQQLMAYQEKQSIADVNREKSLLDWKNSFNDILEKSASLDVQVQSLETTNRSVKRSQDALDEATQRFDRRTNEMTEMQRLMEEKFRQEWATFKSDDQKRWANYSLGQDEIQSEYKRSTELLTNRLNQLEDASVSTNDEAAQRDELYASQIQEAYNLLRTWVEKSKKQ